MLSEFDVIVAIILQLGIAFLLALLDGWLAQFATKWVCKFRPRYAQTFVACLFGHLIAFFLNLLLMFTPGTQEMFGIADWIFAIAGFIATFLIAAWILGKIIRRYATPIGFIKGLAINGILLLFHIAIAGAIAVFNLLMLSVFTLWR